MMIEAATATVIPILHAHSRRDFLTAPLVIMSLARKLSVSFTKNPGPFSIVAVFRVSKLVSCYPRQPDN